MQHAILIFIISLFYCRKENIIFITIVSSLILLLFLSLCLAHCHWFSLSLSLSPCNSFCTISIAACSQEDVFRMLLRRTGYSKSDPPMLGNKSSFSNWFPVFSCLSLLSLSLSYWFLYFPTAHPCFMCILLYRCPCWFFFYFYLFTLLHKFPLSTIVPAHRKWSTSC